MPRGSPCPPPQVPDWVAIIGSGYIGLEFSDVYTALGAEVTFIEAMDKIMPGFDREVARLAERLLITPRNIDYRTGVLASKVTPGIPGVKPVEIELTDFATKEVVDVMEVDAVLVATGRAPYTQGLNLKALNCETDRRGFVPVADDMQVLDKAGKPVEGLWCIGDANGRLMLAHAASAQGIAVVETICGRPRKVNHTAIPASCFTHPEVSFVGLTEEQAKDKAEKEGFPLGVSKTSYKANSKALAELEGDGMAKLIYRKDTGEILGCWIIGIHSPDMIHELSAAMNMGQTVQVSRKTPRGLGPPRGSPLDPSPSRRGPPFRSLAPFAAGYQVQRACPPHSGRGHGGAHPGRPCRRQGPRGCSGEGDGCVVTGGGRACMSSRGVETDPFSLC